MPPRQPTTTSRSRTRRATPMRQALAEVAAELNATGFTKPKRNMSFSPYPDLSMAITMLQKRVEHLQNQQQGDGERTKLISKWLESLEKINTEMQKLHKLEILAGRLTTHPEN